MPKADHALTTYPTVTPTRRSVLSQTARPAVLGCATIPPADALAIVSRMGTANEHADLAEARRLIAALIAADNKVAAADGAGDAEGAEAAEADYGKLYKSFLAFADTPRIKAPRTWPDSWLHDARL